MPPCRFGKVDQLIGKFLTAAALAAAGTSAFADHAAVAVYGAGHIGGWGTGSTQDEAQAQAISACRKNHRLRQCTIQYTAGLALASDTGNLAASRSFESLDDAQEKAMRACDDPACKIVASVVSPGFYALFTVRDGEQNIGVYLYHGLSTRDEAIETGQKECTRQVGFGCQAYAWGAIQGPIEGVSRAVYGLQEDDPK